MFESHVNNTTFLSINFCMVNIKNLQIIINKFKIIWSCNDSDLRYNKIMQPGNKYGLI